MLASQLPFEITIHISNYLSTKDRIECSRVCQAWAIAFQESLWDSIVISDKTTLNNICHPGSAIYQTYRTNGCYVKSLDLGLRLFATDKQLHTLQNHFKNLQYLRTQCSSLSATDFGTNAPNWSMWGTLTKLEMNLGFIKTPHIKAKLLDILACLPRLEQLHIAQDYTSKTVQFTLRDFETLHASLPLLEHLTLDMESQLITTSDLKLVQKNITPATKLKSLVFTVNRSGHRWLYYFAIKYPNIDGLATISFDASEGIETTKAELMTLLGRRTPEIGLGLGPGSLFQKLDKIQTTICQQSSPLHFWIWKKIYSDYHLPLKHLHCAIEEVYDKSNVVKNTFEDCINPYSTSLETLFIQVYENAITTAPWAITDYLVDYRNLVYLRIYTSDAPILVDIILDRCVALKRLGVSTNWLSVGQSALSSLSTRLTLHGLRMLEVYNSTVCSKTFKYISIRCRELNYMCLDYTGVTGYVSINTGKLSIDMPYTHFKTLLLRHIRFTSSRDVKECDRNVNLMALSFKNNKDNNDDELATQGVQEIKKKPKKKLTVCLSSRFPFVSTKRKVVENIKSKKDSKVEDCGKSSWFYTTYSLNSYSLWESNVSRLNEKEVERAREYYDRYSSEIRFVQETTIGAGGNIEGTREKWKKDRFRGYAAIRCDRIDEYIINTNLRRDCSDWDYLYDELDQL